MFYVSDIKQYFYCRRLIYFKKVAPVDFKKTDPMKYGEMEHEVITRLEKRRKLKEYDLKNAERKFHYRVYSKTLNLSGMLDLLLVTSDGRYIPVDFKNTESEYIYHLRYQLTGYALLLEEKFNANVDYGYLYLIPPKRILRLEITGEHREQVLRALDDMNKITADERLPSYDGAPAKCYDCEYRRFCNDVL